MTKLHCLLRNVIGAFRLNIEKYMFLKSLHSWYSDTMCLTLKTTCLLKNCWSGIYPCQYFIKLIAMHTIMHSSLNHASRLKKSLMLKLLHWIAYQCISTAFYVQKNSCDPIQETHTYYERTNDWKSHRGL